MQPTQLGWTAFIVAIASVTSTTAQAVTIENHSSSPNSTIESRIARIQSTLKNSNADLVDGQLPEMPIKTAIGWGNGRGGGTFVNLGRGGWGNGGGGGGFGNINPWRNGWGDRGGFYNRRWPNGGGFINRW
jgi:rSAM-associated Gly-rich repeat protein